MTSPSRELLSRLVTTLFPGTNHGLVAAFAYGSVVFPQHRPASPSDQLDLVLVVKSPVDWHNANIDRNQHHYNWVMSKRFVDCTSFVLSHLPGPQIYYNPLVQWHDFVRCQDRLIKYGIIGLDDLLLDLNTWAYIYVSGRLHKPVSWIPVEGSVGMPSVLRVALARNLAAALAFSLMRADKSRPMSEHELYVLIAGISYEGDYRMMLGEDKDKVRRLVVGRMRLAKYRGMYAPLLAKVPFAEFVRLEPISLMSLARLSAHDESEFQLTWRDGPVGAQLVPLSPGAKLHLETDMAAVLLDLLPDGMCRRAIGPDISDGVAKPAVEARRLLVAMTPNDRNDCLMGIVKRVIARSSVEQTIVGMFSSGFSRSMLYIFAKFRKMFASLVPGRWL